MLNLSDKEIDRLSREASDSYEPDDSSLSWSRLEQKLANQMPERPPDGFRFGRINPYVWSSAIILIAGTSFFLLKNLNYSKHSTRNTQPVNKTITLRNADNKNTSSNTVHLDSIMMSGDLTVAKNNRLSEKDHKDLTSSTNGSASNSQNLPGTLPMNLHIDRDKNADNRMKVTAKSSSDASKSGVVAFGFSEMNRANSSAEQNKDVINGVAASATAATDYKRTKSQIQLPVVVKNGGWPVKVSGNDSLMNQLAQSKTPIHQKSLHVNRSLNIGFTFGPDYTNAGDVANNQIGNYIGLTLGYYLTDKLSVNTGFIYSNKFYWSDAHKYLRQVPNIRPNAMPAPIDYINGASNIWELPLTLRYDFAHHNKTKFFANAGLSSYFIMKQTYIYFIHAGQNQLAYKVFDNQQENYWFGIADISAGFEAEIGKGFSFQAEPFLKLPLRSMGTENLKLTSYGFLMTFKYAPVLSRSRK